MQKYKWVILGVVILFLSLGLVYKEGFVEQSGKYIYSTTMYDNKNYKGHNLYDKMINIDSAGGIFSAHSTKALINTSA